jgi:glycosyltransferase involved in cell wall biosynthesis
MDMNRMKVLFVSSLTGYGGGESSLLRTVKKIKEKGDILPIIAVPHEGQLTERCIQAEIDYVVLDWEVVGKRGKWPVIHWGRLYRLIRWFQKNEIDIVHLNQFEPIWSFALVKALLQIPMVWTCHGQWYHFSTFKQRLIARLIDRIIAVSDNVNRSLVQNNLAHITTTIPLAIDAYEEINSPITSNLCEELGFPSNVQLVIMVARFQPIKGHFVFLEAAEKIISITDRFRFLIIGDNVFGSEQDEAYKKEVIEKVESIKSLNLFVSFLGERKDVNSIMKQSDVLVVPSVNESFGMVILEAFASRCLVIASACDGPIEIISNGKDGFLFPVGDSETLAHMILSISSEQRALMVENGFNTLMNRYDLEQAIERMESLYKSL